MKLGSEEHKQLFCRQFLDSHLKYEPETLAWPELDSVFLERLRAIPFWQEALFIEREAGLMVSAFAETIEDSLIRDAIALQGREESRHARLIEYLINHYQIEITEPPPPKLPSNFATAFTDFGFEECLDSFFAFGMFGIARQANYLPEPIFTIFDPILDEEARHIVFFVNWVTYLQIQQGREAKAWQGAHSLWHYGRAIWGLVKTFGGMDQRDGQGFTAKGATTFMDDLTAEQFFSTCLAENAKRMSVYDPRLLQPQLLPRLSQVALRFLKLLPQRQTIPTTQQS